MAFPTVRSQIATNGTGTSATPVISLPATVAAGDVLFVVFRVAVAGAIGWPGAAGVWNELFDASDDASDDQMAAAWKKADGSEGGTTITLSCTNGKFAAVAYAIAGSINPADRAPQLSTVATGTSTAPNATTVTPTGGAKDYLWLTFTGREGEATVPPTYPTNYTVAQLTADSGTAGVVGTNVRVSGAVRTNNNAASEDAGAWTFSDSEDWAAYTIAFHPGVAVDSPGRSDGVAKPAQRWTVRGRAVGTALVLLTAGTILPPGEQSFGRVATHPRVMVSTQTHPPHAAEVGPPPIVPVTQPRPFIRGPARSSSVSPPQPIVPPDVRLPGQTSATPRHAPRWIISVATSTLPPEVSATPDVRPPGQASIARPPWFVRPVKGQNTGYVFETTWPFIQSSQARPPRHFRVRPWAVTVQPPVAAQAVLPPGKQSAVRPPQRPSTRPWAVVTEQPRPLPPGQQRATPPPVRGHPRPWAVSPEQPRPAPLPIGQQSSTPPPQREAVRPWAVSPRQPEVAQPLPIGRQSTSRPPRRQAVVPWSQSPQQPAVVQAVLPPGQTSVTKPASRVIVRSYIRLVPPPPPQELPVGDTATAKPLQRAATRPWSVSPQQPATVALPVGDQSFALPLRRPSTRPWAVSPAQPATVALPPGKSVAARPPQHTRTPGWVWLTQPPPPEALPVGGQSFGRVAIRGTVEPWAVTPQQPVVVEPQPLPPGVQSNRRPPPPRYIPKSVADGYIFESPEPSILPTGQASFGTVARRPSNRSWSVSPKQPPTQAMPIGRQSFVRPPKRPVTSSWSVSPTQPEAVVVSILPPGQSSIRRPFSRVAQVHRHNYVRSQSPSPPPGGAVGHNNIQPSIVVYIWRRIA